MKIKAEIKKDIKRFIREGLKKKQEEVTIIAPYTILPDDLQEIIKLYPQLESKKLITVVDPNIIAGVVIKMGTKVLDLSLANKIRNLQHSVNEAA